MPTATQPRTHWLVAAGAVWTMIASAIHLTGLSIMTPFVTEQLGFEIGPYQVFYSLLSLATVATMPLAGRLIGRLGARKLLVIGGIIAAAGLTIMGASSQLWHFYLAGIAVGLGVGLGCLYVPPVVVTTWFVAKRGVVMGAVMAGSGIGGIIMSQTVPRLVGVDGERWRLGFVVLAAIMLISTIGPAWLLIRNDPAKLGLRPYGEAEVAHVDHTAAKVAAGMTYVQALRSGWFWLLYVMLTLLGVTTSIYQSIATHLRLIGKTDDLGLFMTALTVGLVITKVLLGYLVDAIGLRASMIITLGAYCAASLLLPGALNTWLLIILMIGMAAGTANATVVPPLAGAITVGNRDFPAIWGIGATAFSLGNGIGTPLWGAMKDATGNFDLSFQVVPALVLVFTLGIFLAMSRGRASYLAPARP